MPLQEAQGLLFRRPEEIALVREEAFGRLEVTLASGAVHFRPGPLEALGSGPLVEGPGLLVNPRHARLEGGRPPGPAGRLARSLGGPAARSPTPRGEPPPPPDRRPRGRGALPARGAPQDPLGHGPGRDPGAPLGRAGSEVPPWPGAGGLPLRQPQAPARPAGRAPEVPAGPGGGLGADGVAQRPGAAPGGPGAGEPVRTPGVDRAGPGPAAGGDAGLAVRALPGPGGLPEGEPGRELSLPGEERAVADRADAPGGPGPGLQRGPPGLLVPAPGNGAGARRVAEGAPAGDGRPGRGAPGRRGGQGRRRLRGRGRNPGGRGGGRAGRRGGGATGRGADRGAEGGLAQGLAGEEAERLANLHTALALLEPGSPIAALGGLDLFRQYQVLLADLVWQGLFDYRALGFEEPRPDLEEIGETRPDLVVLVEKATTRRMVTTLARTFGASLVTLGGQASLLVTEYFAVALRERWSGPVQVRAYVDYDPWGWAIARAFCRQLGRYGVEVRDLRFLVRPERFTEEELATLPVPLPDTTPVVRRTVDNWMAETGGVRGARLGLHADHLRPVERLVAAMREEGLGD